MKKYYVIKSLRQYGSWVEGYLTRMEKKNTLKDVLSMSHYPDNKEFFKVNFLLKEIIIHSGNLLSIQWI